MMDAGRVFGRGISFPMRLGPDGRIAFSEGPTNIREAIQVILLTQPGERVQLPEFGGRLREFLFEPNTVATRRLIQEQIQRVVQQWEPRIALESVAVDPDAGDPRVVVATVRYQLVATQASEQASLRVQLAG